MGDGCCGPVSGGLPAHQRPADAPIGVYIVKAVAAQIAHEISLGLGILTRTQAIDDVLVLVHEDAAARTAIRANAFLRLEEPDALLVEEVLAAQGTHRA